MSDHGYRDFIASKFQSIPACGFPVSALPESLFDFQRAIVAWAVGRGKAAIFADTGLGKTAMQIAWADQVCRHTGGQVLILAPLCVAQQTVREASRMGVDGVRYVRTKALTIGTRIVVTNYEMMGHLDGIDWAGIILDESSILKSFTGKIRNDLIQTFSHTPYRLSCTATPSPNDYMELGSQSEFIGAMSRVEMLAQFFTHDGCDTSKWRLKGHGKTRFWEWLASWAVYIRSPSDIGFDGSRYILPPLRMHQLTVDSSFIPEGELFTVVAQTLSDRRAAKRSSLDDRVKKTADIVNGNLDYWIVWCHLNDESEALVRAIPDSIEVTGSLPQEEKESRILAFARGETRVIVSKPSIMGWGLNLQHCSKMCFVGMDDSYESYYQAIRRCYRFGQTKPVDVYFVVSEGEGAIQKNLERKSCQAKEMGDAMANHMRDFSIRNVMGLERDSDSYTREVYEKNGFTLHLGDCIEVASEMEPNSIGYTVFSPPFAGLYTYSNSPRDMGNCVDHADFYSHFKFLVGELLRVTMPGRLLSFHCMNLPSTISRDGVIGIHDFRGELIRIFVDAGWIYHSEVVIWKDPVIAMKRTKAIGLLYKQLKKDSCMSRQGIPDYLVTMRKPGENLTRVTKNESDFPVSVWKRYASPVWMDINPSKTLQFRSARETDDERHISPLQLDVIERAIELWSNPGDLVFSPFAGIGSEGYVALQMGRRFVGTELKRSYFDVAVKNLNSAKREQGGLFSTEGNDA